MDQNKREKIIEALKLYRSWMFKENIELHGENYWKEIVVKTHVKLQEEGASWSSLYANSIIPDALDGVSIMEFSEVLMGDFSEEDPSKEK